MTVNFDGEYKLLVGTRDAIDGRFRGTEGEKAIILQELNPEDYQNSSGGVTIVSLLLIIHPELVIPIFKDDELVVLSKTLMDLAISADGGPSKPYGEVEDARPACLLIKGALIGRETGRKDERERLKKEVLKVLEGKI